MNIMAIHPTAAIRQRAPAGRALILTLALLALSGCAASIEGGKPAVYQKGEIAPHAYLSSIVVLKEGCKPYGAACTIASPSGATVILPRIDGAPEWVYEVFAHELCHAVAGVRGLKGEADPCHDEDGGVIRVSAQSAGWAARAR